MFVTVLSRIFFIITTLKFVPENSIVYVILLALADHLFFMLRFHVKISLGLFIHWVIFDHFLNILNIILFKFYKRCWYFCFSRYLNRVGYFCDSMYLTWFDSSSKFQPIFCGLWCHCWFSCWGPFRLFGTVPHVHHPLVSFGTG